MIGSVYDYYLTTYASKTSGKFDTHKKSELRNIYNSIIKISKSSPLYKVDVSEDVQKYAIDLKENARALYESVDSLKADNSNDISQSFASGDDSILTVTTLNLPDTTDDDGDNKTFSDNLNFEVKQLATPQVNTGKYLSNNGLSFSKGEHYFETTVGDATYEFQFNVNDDDSNRSVLEKLNRLINKSKVGIHSVVLGTDSRSALEITSDNTGHSSSTTQFSINSSSNHPEDTIVSDLGIDNISALPQNSVFLLNGLERSSTGNTFTINNQMEITLKGVSPEGNSTSVFLKDNVDSILDSVNNLVSTYNKMVDLAKSKSDSHGDSSRLFSELQRYSKAFKNDLESIGLKFDDDDRLTFDDSIIIQSANEGNVTESLSKLNNFKTGLISKSNDITLNPMKYVDKVMISYPNPIRNYANPYVTSIYSGMMYNGYI